MKLPPLKALSVFEAAARHLNFSRAAEELHVTQAAVSQQIKHLENWFGVALFVRSGRRLSLTEEGQILAPTIRDALQQILQASERVRDRQRSGSLTVSVLPSFASKWLVPRLWRFAESNPEIDVRVSAFEWLVDLNKEDIDLGIRYGRGRWPGLHADFLLSEDIFPVCSPALLKGRHPIREPADLVRHTLLHDDFSREDWKLWLMAAGVKDVNPERGLSFSHTSMMLEAAESGHGVALGRTPLVAEDLARGRLVRPFDLSLSGDYAYYLVCLEERASNEKISAFRNWILAEAALPHL